MVNKRELDELTPQEAQAAAYRAQGLTQSDAYRRAYNVKRAKPKTEHEKASRIRGSRALAAVRCARSSSRSVPTCPLPRPFTGASRNVRCWISKRSFGQHSSNGRF